jgi:hypothetical protein
MQAASECRIHSRLLQNWTNQMDANQGVGHSQKMSLYAQSTHHNTVWVLKDREEFWWWRLIQETRLLKVSPVSRRIFFFPCYSLTVISCLAFEVADLVWKVFVHCQGSCKDDNRSAGQNIPPSPHFFECEMLFTATLIFSETHQSRPHRHSSFPKNSFY